jgi:hypothetical protein
MYVSGKLPVRRLVHVRANEDTTLARPLSSLLGNALASREVRKEKEEEAPPHHERSSTNFTAQRPSTPLVLQL